MITTMQKDRLYMSEIVLANIKGGDARSKTQKALDHSIQSSESYVAFEEISSLVLNSIESNKQSTSLDNTVDYVNNFQIKSNGEWEQESYDLENDLFFGTKETAVYMTLYDDLSYNRSLKTRSTTGTQATASINKCLQIQNESDTNTWRQNTISSNSCYYSSCTMTTIPYHGNKKVDRLRYSDVYFFGRKKAPNPEQMEMGKKVKLQTAGPTNSKPVQTNKITGASTGTSTKTVSIKEDKTCNESTCPAIAQSVKGDMVATVSHIKLGPREPCPVYGKEPCQGPKCIVVSSAEGNSPVKVTTVSNPRRGVFELVIRKMTGAPLAKNELMLEWTPPPTHPSCIIPCILPCSQTVPPFHPSKCKMIVCQPTPCKAKGCRKPCGPPCRSVPCSFCSKKKCNKPCQPCKLRRRLSPRCKPCSPCKPCTPCKPTRPCPPPRKIFKRPSRPSPCKTCSRCRSRSPCGSPKSCKPPSPCRLSLRCKPCHPLSCKSCRNCLLCPTSPCRSCQACPPSPCRPFPPPPCPPLCNPSPCGKILCRGTSCTSSPCLPPCAMVRKKTRKCKSHPRIKTHRKRISPCSNRSKYCPVVRCYSLPGICVRCGIQPCPPRKCCPIIPCKPPRCRSSCSTCCA